MKKIIKRRAGFTLVELLIVMIIIGILAGAMMLVSGSGTDKAEATKIVSDMRTLKTATLLYYADKASVGSVVTRPKIVSGDLDKYMDRKLDAAKYEIVQGTDDSSRWYVHRKGLTNSSGINSKLLEMAPTVGLFVSPNGNATTNDDPFTLAATGAYMRAR